MVVDHSARASRRGLCPPGLWLSPPSILWISRGSLGIIAWEVDEAEPITAVANARPATNKTIFFFMLWSPFFIKRFTREIISNGWQWYKHRYKHDNPCYRSFLAIYSENVSWYDYSIRKETMVLFESRREFTMRIGYEVQRRDVINAGNNALMHLRAAKRDLDSAVGWGIIDVFCGGIFVTTIKQTKMEDANEHIRKAMRNLQRFRSNNVDYVNMDYMRLSDAAIAFDFILDNPIVDLYVQSKIESLRCRVIEAIRRLESYMTDEELLGA